MNTISIVAKGNKRSIPSTYVDCNGVPLDDVLQSLDGGSFTTTPAVVGRNQEAIKEIYAAKRYMKLSKSGSTRDNHCNLFVLAHATDSHSDLKRFTNFKDFVNSVSGINAAIQTGDLVSNPVKAEFDRMNAVVEKFNKPYIQVVGNHEHKTSGTYISCSTLSGYIGNEHTYTFQDFTAYNIKIIALDMFETDISSQMDKQYHMTQTQIDWFVNQLDDALSKGYAVIIGQHTTDKNQVPTDNEKKFHQHFSMWFSGEGLIDNTCSGTMIEDIVDAFKNGKSINKTYTFSDGASSVTVNHTFSKSGVFCCYLCGHKHVDAIGYSPTHPDQLYCMCTCGIQKDTLYNPDYEFGMEVNDLPRVDGEACEDAFNVYAFDLTNRLIKVVRVGARTNYKMQSRDCDCYTF